MDASKFIDLLESEKLLEPEMIVELRRHVAESANRLPPETLARLLMDKERLTESQSTPIHSTSNNPYSVPESPLALATPPKRKAKEVLHVLAFVSILIVWYGVAILIPKFGFVILTALHSTIVAMLVYGDAFNTGLLEDHYFGWIACTVELAFLRLLWIVARRGSLTLTFAVLAFSFLWSLINFIAILVSQCC